MSNNISKKRERRLGKGVSSIDTTVSTASSSKLETKSATPKSVSENLDIGILSNQEDAEFNKVFTWVDHDASTRGRGDGRRRRRHGRKNGSGHRHKQNQNLGRHKDKLLAKLHHGSKVTHTNNDNKLIDTGIMQMDIARVNNPKTCDLGYVNCTNGYNVEESGETCAEACRNGEDCCDGDACTGFTGLICKDGYSCKGEASCFYANIEVVVNGCNGYEACVFAGNGGGSIGAVRNSCIGPAACAFAARDGGNIDGIEDSCNGDEGPCGFAAAGFAEDDQVVFGGGTIGMIKSSCNEGDYVCFSLAYANGTVGDVVNSCEGKEACSLAASFGGSIEGIEDSCQDGEYSCSYAAAGFADDDGTYDPNDGGSIGMIESSCIGENACYKLAYYDGSIGNITSSCKDNNACYFAAYVEGSIGGIDGSCNDVSACEYAAAGSCDEFECDAGGSIGMLKSSCIEGERVCGNLAGFSGTIGDVVDSCDGFFSCYGAASYSGSISGLNMSCIYGDGPDDQEGNACYYMASSYGIIGLVKDSCMSYYSCGFAASCYAKENYNCKAGRIGNITNSCDEEKSCYKMADEGGYVSNVFMSCVGESSCERAAFNGSISEGIVNSCRAERACEGLGEDSDIESQVNSCCNTEGECEGYDEASLPSECSMVTTQSPSKAPSSSPSKIPSSSPSMSPLSPTPSPTSPPSAAPTSAAPTVSLNPTQVMLSKSAKSKGRKSKKSKKGKSTKALSMNLTTSDEDDSKIRRKRIRKHAPGASGKLPSLIRSDEQ